MAGNGVDKGLLGRGAGLKSIILSMLFLALWLVGARPLFMAELSMLKGLPGHLKMSGEQRNSFFLSPFYKFSTNLQNLVPRDGSIYLYTSRRVYLSARMTYEVYPVILSYYLYPRRVVNLPPPGYPAFKGVGGGDYVALYLPERYPYTRLESRLSNIFRVAKIYDYTDGGWRYGVYLIVGKRTDAGI